MKILKLIGLFFVVGLVFSRPIFAVDSTDSAVDKKAQDIRAQMDARVVELAKKLRRVYTGHIKSVGTTSYVVTLPEGDRTITTNDVTSFFRIRASNRTEVNFKALKPGDDVAAIGTVDPTTSEMTAKQIIAKVKRYNIVGKVTAVDKTVYSIAEINGPTTKVDLADAISLKSLNSKGQTATAPISSFKKGDLVFVMAYIFDTKSDVLSALKAIQLTP